MTTCSKCNDCDLPFLIVLLVAGLLMVGFAAVGYNNSNSEHVPSGFEHGICPCGLERSPCVPDGLCCECVDCEEVPR